MPIFCKRKILFIGLMVGAVQSVYAQLPIEVIESLPDAAKPSAQLPQDAFLYPELEPEPGKYIVPPVVDRPLGDTEGPKIKVEAIELRGAADHPDQDLSLDDIWKVIEEDRAARPDGYYIGQLQQLADKITNLYRSKGFILAHAFVPVQTVEDGIITIQVLEGALGNVLVEGNEQYQSKVVMLPFEDMLGQVLFGEDIESALVRLSDYPGLTAFGVFQPGKELGTSDLVVKVQEEKPMDVVYSLDNHGSRLTGEYLSRVDVGLNNLFGRADKVNFAIRGSLNPSLSELLTFGYSQMIFKPQYWIEFGGDTNEYDLDDGEAGVDGVEGRTDSGYFRFKHKVDRGRTKNTYWSLDVHRKQSLSSQNADRLARDNLTVFGLEYDHQALDLQRHAFSHFVVKWSHGEAGLLGAMASDDEKSSRRTGDGTYASSRFDKLTASYERLISIDATTSLLLRGSMQYTDDPLFGLEQFVLGGTNSVRAYSGSEVIMDRGFFVSAEHLWNAPGFADKPSPFGSRKWGEVLTASAFLDWGYGEKLDRLDTEDKSVSLRGWGVGAQLAVPGAFTGKLTISWPFMHSQDPDNEREPQIFVSLIAQVF